MRRNEIKFMILLFFIVLQIPNDPELMIDLQQACVILMCHVDRLVTPYLPSLTEPRISSSSADSSSTNHLGKIHSSEVCYGSLRPVLSYTK